MTPMFWPAQRVYLLSCVGKKRMTTDYARSMYISPWFNKARAYVEATSSRWYILSAVYGLIAPDAVIHPYEKTLNKMTIGERKDWTSTVMAMIEVSLPDLETAVILAGNRYREFLVPALEKRGIAVEVPMKGMSIGKQLQWLERNTPTPKRRPTPLAGAQVR